MNLTGHPLTLLAGDQSRLVESTRAKARVDSKMRLVDRVIVDGMVVPVLSVAEVGIVGLPEPQDGVLYVVSGLVAAHAGRTDVVCPSRIEWKNGASQGARALAIIERK